MDIICALSFLLSVTMALMSESARSCSRVLLRDSVICCCCAARSISRLLILWVKFVNMLLSARMFVSLFVSLSSWLSEVVLVTELAVDVVGVRLGDGHWYVGFCVSSVMTPWMWLPPGNLALCASV